MAINDVVGEWVYHVWDSLSEFLGHIFVSGLPTLKPKSLKKLKETKKLKPKTFSLKKLGFSSHVLSHFRTEQGQYADCTSK